MFSPTDDLYTCINDNVLQMTRMVLKGMAERKRGVILNLSSASGARPTPLISLYSAAKVNCCIFSSCLCLRFHAFFRGRLIEINKTMYRTVEKHNKKSHKE